MNWVIGKRSSSLTRVFLGLLFFAVTITGIIRRTLFGKKLATKLDQNATTYWSEIPKSAQSDGRSEY